MQLGHWRFGPAELLDRILQVGPHQVLLHRLAILAVNLLHDPALGIGGEAFVEPEVVPRRIGDQIARPAVRQLMRGEADEAAVPGDRGGRDEGQHRVFHAAIGKARRQDQQIVAAPAIRAVQILRGFQEARQIGEFVRRLVDHRRLRPHAGIVTDRLETQIADRQRDQIRRDGLVHRIGEGAAIPRGERAKRRLARAAHHHVHAFGHGDLGIPGLADAGAVLRRDPASVEDRLTLAEHEGQLLAQRLLGLQPLQRLGVRRGLIGDRDGPRSAQLDGQRRAVDRIAGAELVIERVARAIGDGTDGQMIGVEHDLVRACRRRDVQRCRAGEDMIDEIGLQIERDMRDARLAWVGVAVHVLRFRRQQDRRDRRGGGFGRVAGRFFEAVATGERNGEGEGGEERETHGAAATCRQGIWCAADPSGARRESHGGRAAQAARANAARPPLRRWPPCAPAALRARRDRTGSA